MQQYDRIMIRFGELSTKGKNKRNFIQQLAENLMHALKPFSSLTYEVKMDHIYIVLHDSDVEPILERIADVSGIQSYSLVVRVEPTIEAILDKAQDLMKEEEGLTFKVKAKRADKTFPVISDEINRKVASVILKEGKWKVDVHHPDILLSIVVRENACYLFTKTYLGAGGYPLGVGGKVMMMMSGGIDSPVAAYLLMKRGVLCEFIHFASPPYTSEAVLDKIRDLAEKLTRYQQQIRIHIVPFTRLQEEIYRHVDESYAITLMRRMMYRLGERLAERRRCLAIANGESIGQVASQTLASMYVINRVSQIPTIRPLAVYDKSDIITIAKKIGTYDISIRPYEDCCTIFEPKNPKTAPKLAMVEELEKRFDYESLIEEALANTEVIFVNSNQKDEKFL